MRQLTITQSITNRGSLSLEKYLQEIAKVAMVTPDEEIRLARAIKQGDLEALETLTKANLRFVVSVAKQYQYHGLSLSDLINEGNLGLIRAAKRFDETRGFKFISYAVWWIRQSIMQALSEQGRIVRLPANRIGMGSKVQYAYSQFEQEHERSPSAEELAEELNITADEVISVSDFNNHHLSLDLPVNESGDATWGDQMADSNTKATDAIVDYTESLQIEIRRCLESLPDREKEILCSFFGIDMPNPMSLQEIAIKYNMGSERIRQIKDKAIKQLRTPKKAALLKQYLRA
jgi:RNA polymerase primary sigma factor